MCAAVLSFCLRPSGFLGADSLQKSVWQGGEIVTPDGVTLLRPRYAAGLPAAPPMPCGHI
ncbi:TPA: hypothetical protein ACPT1G_004348 [Escherichia coli]|nr:hypothetical protein [Salmonella enterica subsp. enterica serovar Infantis]